MMIRSTSSTTVITRRMMTSSSLPQIFHRIVVVVPEYNSRSYYLQKKSIPLLLSCSSFHTISSRTNYSYSNINNNNKVSIGNSNSDNNNSRRKNVNYDTTKRCHPVVVFTNNLQQQYRYYYVPTVMMLQQQIDNAAAMSSETRSHFLNPTTTTLPPPPQITLYQYTICPFCNRVKALLDYTRIPYTSIEVNPLTKNEITIWKNQYKKVPIVTIQNYNNDNTTNNDQYTKQQQQQDDNDDGTTSTSTVVIFGSDEIIQQLLQHPFVQQKLVDRWNSGNRNRNINTNTNKDTISSTDTDLVPNHRMTLERFTDGIVVSSSSLSSSSTTTVSSNTKNWIKYATDDLASLLYPNLCSTISDSYRAFGYVTTIPNFTSFQKVSIRFLGSLAMYMAAAKVKKRLGITDERKALQDALLHFENDGLQPQQQQNGTESSALFLSGLSEPNLNDITVFGVLRSLEGLPIHSQIIRDPNNNNNNNNNNTPLLSQWYEQMTLKMKDPVV